MTAKNNTHILLTGASGLLGTEITSRLDQKGIPWKALRHGEKGWDPEAGEFDPEHLQGVDGIIHLAGENIASGRWTETQKKKIRESRVLGTRALAQGIAASEEKPSFFICASATGIYGDRGEEDCTETTDPAEGFLSEVVQDWEAAADPAREAGVRVAHLRLGIVLSSEGGALKKMLPPFRLGLGGRLGNGRMWMSWIHLDDAAHAFVETALDSDRSGAINVVSPYPVRNSKFTRALGSALHRPTPFPVPAFIISLLFGEMGRTLLLSSTRVTPQKLNNTGFSFGYPTIESALNGLLH